MTDLSVLRRLDALERTLERLRKAEIPGAAVSYTPTYTGATSAGVTTYSVQQGWYWTFGNLVFVTGLVVWTAATGTGDAQISLPLTPSTTIGFRASGGCRVNGVTFANSAPQILVSPTAALFTLDSPLTNAAPTTVQVEAAGNVVFSLFYGVD